MNSHRGVKAQKSKSILDSDFDKNSLNSRNSNNERIKSMLQVHKDHNPIIETKSNATITKKLRRQLKKQLTQKRQIEINRE